MHCSVRERGGIQGAMRQSIQLTLDANKYIWLRQRIFALIYANDSQQLKYIQMF